jgi:hypothetical protein
LHGAGSATTQLAARVSGYNLAFAAAAILLAVGAVLLAAMLRPRHVRGLELDLAPSGAPA